MSVKIKITKKMKRTFHNETAGNLELFEKMLFLLEKEPENQEAIHSAFRAVHSIKGNTDYLGIEDINILANELESLMHDIRSNLIVASRPVVSVLFKGLDMLTGMNQRILDEEYEESDLSEIINAINRLKMATKDRFLDSADATSQNHDSPQNHAASQNHASTRKIMDIMQIFLQSSSQHIDRIKNI
ncbi:MAG: Hpt domain-containing protein, partial [Desulfamplus sp.]|nr:Hpt domain-containing protein [Desulfamplus sp.]